MAFQIAAKSEAPRMSLMEKIGNAYNIEPKKLADIMKHTCFKQPRAKDGQPQQEVSDEQLAALLVVADKYGLNPFTKEIYAFPDKQNGIVPVVGVDGWTRIAQENPNFDGFDICQSKELVQVDPENGVKEGKSCPEWIEVTVYKKNQSHPTVVREYLDECYRRPFRGNGYTTTGPWQSHPKRMLRHKALIQAFRTAFGFAGIYEDDEAERIASARVVAMNDGMAKALEVDQSALPEPTIDITAMFREQAVASGIDLESVSAFIKAWSDKQKVGEDKIMKSAISNFADFLKYYRAWLASQQPSPKPRKSRKAEQPAAPAADYDPETGEVTEPTGDNLSPTQHRPTVDKSSTDAPVAQSATTAEKSSTVECPDRDDLPVSVEYCNTKCAKRNGCPMF